MTEFDMSLPNDIVLQRFVAKRIKAMSPLEFTMQSGKQWRGWVSGIDDETIQLCQCGSLKIVMLNRSSIESVEEYELVAGLTKYQSDEVKGFTKRMTLVAEKALDNDRNLK